MGRATCATLIAALVTAVAAGDAAAPAPTSRRAAVRGRKRRPPSAFQASETIFELPVSEYARSKPYLIQFKGKGDDYCSQMEPLMAQLKEELGIEVRQFEVWYDSKNIELMQRLDRGRCGGVPFFYNKRTKRYICGATTYANLRAWALSEPCEPILPPPNLIAQQQQANQNPVQKFFQKAKAKAQEKLQERQSSES